MKFRFFYIVLYVTVIGLLLSFALSKGNKVELNYYDFAELISYNNMRDSINSVKTRFIYLGLDKKARNELKIIMENFDLENHVDNSLNLCSSEFVNFEDKKYYFVVVSMKNEPYILTIHDRKDFESFFDLDKIIKIDSRFYYINNEKNSTITFKNRELKKKLDDFIRKNESFIDEKMSNLEQEQPKYSSPMIQWLHECYGETVEWFEDRYYDFTHP